MNFEEESLNRTFQDIMDQVGGINSECNEIIEKFQNEQLESLKIEVESLRQQNLMQKQIIEHLRKSEAELKQVNDILNGNIKSLLKNNNSENESFYETLTSIENTESLTTKTSSFIDFIMSNSNGINTKNEVNCSLFQNYINMLTRFIKEPNYAQNKIFSNDEESHIDSISLKTLVDEVKDTSNLLENKERDCLYKVSDILDLKIDNNKRSRLVEKILQSKEIPYEEMKLLFIQEVSITTAIKQYANKCLNALNENSNEKSKLISLHSLLSKLLKKDNLQYSLSSLIKMVNQLCNHYVEFENGKKDSIKNEKIEDSVKEWVKWAKSLFYAITGETSDSIEDIKITIEETSLSATGNKWNKM